MSTGSPLPDAPGVGATCKPMRQKYWSELDGQEKVERMREQVKYLQEDIRRLSVLVDKLRGHSHHENGQLLISLEDNRPMEFRPVKPGDEVYF